MDESFTERTEVPQPEPAYALADLLGVPVPDLGAGLPPLWHWAYLLDRPALADLGPDGHPVRGTLPAPPGHGRRRMWAGGRVAALGPLRCGEPATRRTRVLKVTEKHGRSGHLTFVTVGVQVLQGGAVVVDEEQDIVYRDAAGPPGAAQPAAAARPATGQPAAAAKPAAAKPAAAKSAEVPAPVVPAGQGEREIAVSPLLLFRFSALTYNAHRIHYDRDYCRDVEGYPGLLTHGPLQALAMAEAARAAGAAGGRTVDVSFAYRLVSPLFDDQGLIVGAVKDTDGTTVTTARDRYGRQTATGTFT